jgi:hypothetical protein
VEDTSRAIGSKQNLLWNALSVEQRLQRVGNLFDLARSFAEARAPKHFSAEEKRCFVFREFYGFDLPVKTKQQDR